MSLAQFKHPLIKVLWKGFMLSLYFMSTVYDLGTFLLFSECRPFHYSARFSLDILLNLLMGALLSNCVIFEVREHGETWTHIHCTLLKREFCLKFDGCRLKSVPKTSYLLDSLWYASWYCSGYWLPLNAAIQKRCMPVIPGKHDFRQCSAL